MLKLMWSWILLVLMVALIFLYQPDLLSSSLLFNYDGSQFSIPLWIVMFLMAFLIILALTIANMVFFWQRRLLIRKCKKMMAGIRAFEETFRIIKSDGDPRKLLKSIRSIPVYDIRELMIHSILRDDNNQGSYFSLWWHGHWAKLSELLLTSEINSIWKMNFCCHLFLSEGMDPDMYKLFIAKWSRFAIDFQHFLPTIFYKVQLKLFAHYDQVDDLLQVWGDLPRQYRKDENYILEYVKSLAAFEQWGLVCDLCRNLVVKSDQLLIWYSKNLPVKYLDITMLQKWLRLKSGNKYILYALARAYADTNSWSTVDKLITEINDKDLTYKINIKLLIQKNDMFALKQVLS